MKVGDKLTIEIYEEVCCDMCNNIIHNHMDCPVCKKEYASTNRYNSMYHEDGFSCEECNAEFKLIDYYYGDAIVELIKLRDENNTSI